MLNPQEKNVSQKSRCLSYTKQEQREGNKKTQRNSALLCDENRIFVPQLTAKGL